MKTIEERAEEACIAWSYGELDHDLLESCFVDGFFAGAKSEREELLRWRDPKEELPEEGEDVLIKLITGQCEVGCYIEHVNWRGADGIVDDYIAGWRPIVELPEDGEKIE